jgi:hypothetical protein
MRIMTLNACVHDGGEAMMETILRSAKITILALALMVGGLMIYVNYYLPHGPFQNTGYVTCQYDDRGRCGDVYKEDLNALALPWWAKFIRSYDVILLIGLLVAWFSLTIKGQKEESKRNVGPNFVLSFDEQWKHVQDQLCLVTEFRPGKGYVVKDGVVNSTIGDALGMYCLIVLECKSVFGGRKLDGLISHKEDFKNLWGAFKERGINAATEEVLIMWSTKHYKDKYINFVANWLRQRVFMPKILVLVCPKGTYEQCGDSYKWSIDEKPQDVVRTLKATAWCVSDVMN